MAKGTVLIVDDEPDVRALISIALTNDGYDVIEAEDGEKGITAVKSGDNPQKLVTIICDLHMPKISGVEAIAYFRAQLPSVPVVVMTGKPEFIDIGALFSRGVVDYLIKPMTQEEVIAAVSKAVKARALFKDQFSA